MAALDVTVSDRQVEILRLLHLENRGYQEVAEKLGMQPAAVALDEALALKVLIRRYLLVQEAAS